MTEPEKFAKTIRELAKDCPITLVVLPPCSTDFRPGVYVLSSLLKMIAISLEFKAVVSCFQDKARNAASN